MNLSFKGLKLSMQSVYSYTFLFWVPPLTHLPDCVSAKWMVTVSSIQVYTVSGFKFLLCTHFQRFFFRSVITLLFSTAYLFARFHTCTGVDFHQCSYGNIPSRDIVFPLTNQLYHIYVDYRTADACCTFALLHMLNHVKYSLLTRELKV